MTSLKSKVTPAEISPKNVHAAVADALETVEREHSEQDGSVLGVDAFNAQGPPGRPGEAGSDRQPGS